MRLGTWNSRRRGWWLDLGLAYIVVGHSDGRGRLRSLSGFWSVSSIRTMRRFAHNANDIRTWGPFRWSNTWDGPQTEDNV